MLLSGKFGSTKAHMPCWEDIGNFENQFIRMQLHCLDACTTTHSFAFPRRSNQNALEDIHGKGHSSSVCKLEQDIEVTSFALCVCFFMTQCLIIDSNAMRSPGCDLGSIDYGTKCTFALNMLTILGICNSDTDSCEYILTEQKEPKIVN